MSPLKQKVLIAHAIVVAGLLLLCWPPRSAEELLGADGEPFRWDRDALFSTLEREFLAARATPPEDVAKLAARILTTADEALTHVEGAENIVEPSLATLETSQFRLAALAAAHPVVLPSLAELTQRTRRAVLDASARWTDKGDVPRIHELLYRVVQGGRIALEEALVQAGTDTLPAVNRFEQVKAATPSKQIQGVMVHSGDILLSRGGAPTSALIARGNDFPGNFSHAALVHIDEAGKANVVESLIEKGLVVTGAEEYLRDKKLRISVLRPRPELLTDPLAPHIAATRMLERARTHHVHYDFRMMWSDPQELFCSEVVYHAYADVGLQLWTHQSKMSAPGLVAWLGSLGVRQFTTLVPSDLEYDSQLLPVAEWRDPSELRADRRDNAIIDALLEAADRGARLDYRWYELPVARLAKVVSLLSELVGIEPIIPHGMGAATAARVTSLQHKVFPSMRAGIAKAEEGFLQDKGYEAPYWVLVDLARKILDETEFPGALTLPGSMH